MKQLLKYKKLYSLINIIFFLNISYFKIFEIFTILIESNSRQRQQITAREPSHEQQQQFFQQPFTTTGTRALEQVPWTASDQCGNQSTFTQTVNVSCILNVFNAYGFLYMQDLSLKY
jgi:hypothetical protein